MSPTPTPGPKKSRPTSGTAPSAGTHGPAHVNPLSGASTGLPPGGPRAQLQSVTQGGGSGTPIVVPNGSRAITIAGEQLQITPAMLLSINKLRTAWWSRWRGEAAVNRSIVNLIVKKIPTSHFAKRVIAHDRLQADLVKIGRAQRVIHRLKEDLRMQKIMNAHANKNLTSKYTYTSAFDGTNDGLSLTTTRQVRELSSLMGSVSSPRDRDLTGGFKRMADDAQWANLVDNIWDTTGIGNDIQSLRVAERITAISKAIQPLEKKLPAIEHDFSEALQTLSQRVNAANSALLNFV